MKRKKIILSGGGTGGPVMPLIFVYQELRSEFDFLFVGTYQGVERKIVKNEKINYRPIVSGKWRRYFSFLNFIDLFKIFFAFWQSLFILRHEKPDLVVSAGGFVAVPLSYAAWFLKIPILIHQQDVQPGLANKLMAPIAKKITTTFSASLSGHKKKTEVIGNIGFVDEKNSLDRETILKKYQLKNQKTVLILGGGTGSLFINNLVKDAIPIFPENINIIHVYGQSERCSGDGVGYKNYYQASFIAHQELMDIMGVSDLVVTRAGLSTLTEISFLAKASIIIPIPNSHQEHNASVFKDSGGAIVLSENEISPQKFAENVLEIVNNNNLNRELSLKSSQVIKNGNQKMITIVKSILK